MSVQVVTFLLKGIGFVGSKNVVQGFESRFGVDDESSEMSTWSKLEDIQSGDVARINSWKISSEILYFLIFVFSLVGSIDDQWTLSHDVS
jgi:hypothetical protein